MKLKGFIIFRINFFALIYLFTSCSIIDTIIKRDLDDLNNNKKDTQFFNESITCPNSEMSIAVSSDSAHANEQYYNFLQALAENNIKTSFIEKAIMFSMIQMAIRPDMASPTSRFTYGITTNNNFDYKDYTAKDTKENSYPFLYGLYKLSLEHKTRSVQNLARLLDKFFPNGVSVVAQVQAFVLANKKILKAHPDFNSLYFRGKQGIKRNETLKRVKFKEVTNLINLKTTQNNLYNVDQNLFTFKTETPHEIRCNYDLNLYSHDIYLKNDTDSSSIPFILIEGDSSFVATISATHLKNFSLNLPPLINTNSKKGQRPAICQIKSDNNMITIASTKDRDPAQIIYNLLTRHNIAMTQNSLQEMLEMGRIVKFLNPFRYIVEHNLVKEKTLTDLHQYRVPIYHHYPIGNIILSHLDTKQKTTTPILDRRYNNQLLCK